MKPCVALLLALLLASCGKPAPSAPTQPATPTAMPATAKPASKATVEYTGSQTCQLCHTSQHQDWRHSDHHQAMMEMSESTVKGHFGNTALQHHGQTTRMTLKDGAYAVQTDQNTTTPAELPLAYTFGIYPLQQYLTTLPGGRWQALPFAWDARPPSTGGQQWFHLYRDENIVPDDALHWRSLSHNANHMCIECHTTNFTKAYDAEKDSYQSSWQETGVGCESCHGPGSQHVQWARSPDKSTPANKGWDLPMTSGSMALWRPQSAEAPPKRLQTADTAEIERCAQCHSRRGRISESNREAHLLDAFLPTLLDEPLYFPDGQIQDEVYEYGSFLQSKMAAHGVTCSNCHNPHSGKTKAEGNALCLQCHAASFDSEKHTMHNPGSAGSQCVDCHMPKRLYMQVDARRDHSLRVPRPDLSDALATPNACQQCHTDKKATWAANAIDQHTGNRAWRKPHYGQVFAQARRAWPESFSSLVALLDDTAQPPIVRATAISLLPNFPTRDIVPILDAHASSDSDLIRLAVVRAAETLPPDQQTFLLPLLRDDRLAVRIETARILAGMHLVSGNSDYEQAIKEYIQSQTIQADTAAANTNLANLAMREHKFQEAENFLQKALELEPYYIPAAVNLSDLYRLAQRDSEGETVLLNALQINPDNAELKLAYALWLVRNGRSAEATPYLAQASQTGDHPRFDYVYAVALKQVGKNREAMAALDKAMTSSYYSRDVRLFRIQLALESGQEQLARQYIAEWRREDPQDPALNAFR